RTGGQSMRAASGLETGETTGEIGHRERVGRLRGRERDARHIPERRGRMDHRPRARGVRAGHAAWRLARREGPRCRNDRNDEEPDASAASHRRDLPTLAATRIPRTTEPTTIGTTEPPNHRTNEPTNQGSPASGHRPPANGQRPTVSGERRAVSGER